MRFAAPETIAEAVTLLAEEGARCLAGGQSLVAMMNADLVAPAALVSLRRIAPLSRLVERADGGLVLGAMATHAAVARLTPSSAGAALMARTAAGIGHPAIRNQGTIGGSLAHADPAADYPTAVTCAEATIVVAGAAGARRVAAADFFAGYYETALQPGEMIIEIEIPPGPEGARARYEKFVLIDGDFAAASVAAIVAMHEGRCTHARIAVGACAPKPVRETAAEKALVGTALDDDALKTAGAILAEACDPVDDFRASAAFRRKLVPRLIKRAVLAARDEAMHG